MSEGLLDGRQVGATALALLLLLFNLAIFVFALLVLAMSLSMDFVPRLLFALVFLSGIVAGSFFGTAQAARANIKSAALSAAASLLGLVTFFVLMNTFQ